MGRKNILLFLTAYFLIIFLWLAFCYKQVQEACISNGHTTDTAMEVISWSEEESAQRAEYEAEYGVPFFSWLEENVADKKNIGKESIGKENIGKENIGKENTGIENTGIENTEIENTGKENTGKENTEIENTEIENTGIENIGKENTGIENTGKENIGIENTGEEITGIEDTENGIEGENSTAKVDLEEKNIINGDAESSKTVGENAERDSGQESSMGGNSAGQEASLETIRVVLTGTEGIYHKEAVLQADGEKLVIKPDSTYFADTDIIRVRLSDQGAGMLEVTSLEKSCGHPYYEGFLEIRKEGDRLVLINEVPLESYVKGVLPSEMPSSYPLEALKAQAVCARTYAGMKQEKKAYPEYRAAVDDSTACQVYRNIETSPQGDQAVEETAGEMLVLENGGFAECYYYSTSCGRSATGAVWHSGEKEEPALKKTEEEITEMNQKFFDFIREKQETDPEVTEPFYRWNYQCEKADYGEIFKRCRQRQAVNARLVRTELSGKDDEAEAAEITEKNLGKITGMDIAERQEGGVADCLRISCKKGTVYVWGEYNIRCVLAQGGSIVRQDETEFKVNELLPSAFLSLQSICNEKGNMVGYIVVGGGFGHGVGMSQNGAKHMAASGCSYEEILAAYYPESKLVKQ